MYRLRGHHLLCLLGYRGMGYSQEYVQEMTKLHAALRENPENLISIVLGPDDLCAHFPEDKPYHCEDENVYIRDQSILTHLGIKVGEQYRWEDLLAAIQHRVVPDDIPRFCETCPWRPYGVCEEGVERIRRGEGMMPVEP